MAGSEGSTRPAAQAVCSPRDSRVADRFYWHVGMAATLGFVNGTIAVMAAALMQAWLDRWVWSLLVGLLVLFLGTPLAVQILAWAAGRPDRSRTTRWLERLGSLWMGWV